MMRWDFDKATSCDYQESCFASALNATDGWYQHRIYAKPQIHLCHVFKYRNVLSLIMKTTLTIDLPYFRVR